MDNLMNRRSMLLGVATGGAAIAAERAGAFPRHGAVSAVAPLGLIGTGPHFAGTFDNTGNTWTMSRSHHVALENITRMDGVVFANFTLLSNGAAEFGNAHTATVTASIEYPAGTFTQLTFSGVAQGIMAAVPTTASGGATVENGSIVSDPITGLSIPNGADYWIRFYFTNPNGIWFDNGQDVPNGEAMAFGTTIAGGQDQTMGGTITDSGSHQFCAHPVCIIGRTNLANGFSEGDSIDWGLNGSIRPDPSATSFFRSGAVCPGIPGTIPILNMGSSSNTATNAIANSPGRYAIKTALGGAKYNIFQFVTNDIFVLGKSVAQIIASLTAIANLYPSTKNILTTCMPRNTSSSDWSTLGAQSVLPQESVRLAWNAAVRAGTTGIPNVIGYFELADAVESARDSGKWGIGTGTETIDGIHPNAHGYALANANVAAEYTALLT